VKLFIKNTTVFLLITNLLVAHVGVSMEWLYCACKGQIEVSLFHIEEHCAKTEKEACCKKEAIEEVSLVKPCCKKFEKIREGITAKKAHDCTTKGNAYFKADLKFTTFESSDLKHFDFAFTPFLFPQNADNQHFVSQENYFSLPNNKAPPPRPANRALLLLIQSFLC
jgi:hypothetical protein